MVLLARAGQRSAALKQYEACRRVLAEELATAPDEATVGLAERLRAGPRAVPHNLPPQPVPFVGREAELSQLAERLDDPACRLICLVGLGGSGKTRLALEAARRYADPAGALEADPFRDGVFLVPLAEVSPGAPGATADEAAGRITRAIAGVLGIPLDAAGDPVLQLARALEDKALLLVLDNLEHLVEGAPVLWHLVRQAPRVKLVVTSRVRLRLLGEWELEVGGLPVPAGPDPGDLEWAGASALFLQAVRRARPGLAPEALSAADRAAVVRLCRLAGGLPLPLVLAAAWAPVRSFVEIAAELAAAVDVPGGPGEGAPLRGLPARQRRVGDVLGAAWARLPAPDQVVLRWLPLFRGGFTREAARAVLGAGPQQLLALLDLLLVSVSAPDGERYELNELVSRYADHQQAGRPEERARAAARHAAYFAGYVQERAPELRRSRQAVAELERERPNVLAAWEWAAAQGHADLLERLRPALLLFERLAASPLRPAVGVGSALQTLPAPPPGGGRAGLGVQDLATASRAWR
jgi:predicted ATPase